MSTHRTSRFSGRLSRAALAILGLFALIATACGAGVSQGTAERAVVNAGQSSATGETAAAAPAAATDTAAGGHAYGTSLDDWTPTDEDANAAPSDSAAAPSSDFAVIGWEDLVPPGASGADIVAKYQDELDAVEPGSVEATALYEKMQAEFDSGAVNEQLDSQKIRLAGFVAPLTYDDDIVVEFLLVPTFGACIHVPPPPPNQTVMVSVDKDKGLTLEEAWGPVWVEGTMVITDVSTDIGEASYEIVNGLSGVYTDF